VSDSPLFAGAEVALSCRHLDEQGAGVGEAGGFQVHVAGALPGETVTAAVEHVSPHGDRAWARLLVVQTPSPERVPPVCPGYGRCGGCPLQHLAYPAQVRWKGERVREVVAGEPALAGVAVAACAPSPRVLGYRNQGKYVYGRAASGVAVLGGYAPRTHQVVDLAGCRVVEPAIDQVAVRLRELLERQAVPPFDERQGRGDLRYVVIRANVAEQVLVTLVAGRRDWEAAVPLAAELRALEPRVGGVVLNVNGGAGNVLYGPEEIPLAGRPTLLDQVGDIPVELAARSFFQVNREMAARAYQDLRESAAALGPLGRVVDAYAGAGGIAFALSPLAKEVVAIEESAAATDAASRFAGGRAGQVRFVTGDVAEHLAAVGSADLVVLNPPRAGCAPAVLEAAAALRPRLVAYLSCHPATLIRDLALLRQRGFVTVEIRPYDMLPHTPHVEALALVTPLPGC
jgi:23S rRNA (uracil1939-C5)-methyltransferase